MTAEPPRLRPGPRDAITDVRGIRVGHWTNRRAATGCTVILCESGPLAAVDVRGGAPGTRETDVLAPANSVRRAHAILLAGGSAFGLGAADGVMRFLAERDIGVPTTSGPVPMVPTAILFDRGLRQPAHPGPDDAYRAASAATGGRVREGSVGAGTGATVAKLLGPGHELKSGLGTASIVLPGGITVGAIVAVNALGSIVDPATGETIAGPRGEPGRFVPSDQAALQRAAQLVEEASEKEREGAAPTREATTLVCIATDADIDHNQLQRLAAVAHDGLSRTIVPVHTLGDGDVAFALAMGSAPISPFDLLPLGMAASLAVERAVLSAVRNATGLGGVPSMTEWIDSARKLY